MESLNIKSNVINNKHIPSFELHLGNIGCIILDGKEDDLIDYLTGKKVKKEITLKTPFIRVTDFNYKATHFDKITKRHLVRNYIKRKLKCNDLKVREILKKAEIGYDWDMNLYGNARRLLSILIGMEMHNHIIYSAEAIDSEGVTKLQKLVKEEISKRDGCAIEIIHKSIQNYKGLETYYDNIIEIK